MKALFTALSLLLAISSPSFAHEEDRRVEMEPASNAPIQNVDHKFRFQLLDTKTKKLLSTTDLEVSHEKKLHFLAYDSALKEFQHVHPEFDGEFWSIDLRFNVSGTYWLWAQGLLNDGEEFSAPTDTKVMLKGKPGWPLPPRLSDARSGVDGVSKVTLSNTKLFANKMVTVTVKMSRTDGGIPQITPYLGAFAHVIAVTDDADSLIHVHPMNGSKPEEGMLHATFPTKGIYRLWIQFLDGGHLRTIPLSVSVAP